MSLSFHFSFSVVVVTYINMIPLQWSTQKKPIFVSTLSLEKLRDVTNQMLQEILSTHSEYEDIVGFKDKTKEGALIQDARGLATSVSQIIGNEQFPIQLFPVCFLGSSLPVSVSPPSHRVDDILPPFKQKLLHFLQLESLYKQAEFYPSTWLSIEPYPTSSSSSSSSSSSTMMTDSKKKTLSELFQFHQFALTKPKQPIPIPSEGTASSEQEDHHCLEMGQALMHIVNVVSSLCVSSEGVCTKRCERLCKEVQSCLQLMTPFPVPLCSVLISCIHLFLHTKDPLVYSCVFFEQAYSLTLFLVESLFPHPEKFQLPASCVEASDKQVWFACMKDSMTTSLVETWLLFILRVDATFVPKEKQTKVSSFCLNHFFLKPDQDVQLINKIKCFRLFFQYSSSSFSMDIVRTLSAHSVSKEWMLQSVQTEKELQFIQSHCSCSC